MPRRRPNDDDDEYEDEDDDRPRRRGKTEGQRTRDLLVILAVVGALFTGLAILILFPHVARDLLSR